LFLLTDVHWRRGSDAHRLCVYALWSMPLTRYGVGVWLPILLATALFAAAFLWLGWWIVAVVVLVIGLALLAFFRDPIRRIAEDLPPGSMLSPADGTVSAVLDVDSHEAISGGGGRGAGEDHSHLP
jgi:hypothetical protein